MSTISTMTASAQGITRMTRSIRVVVAGVASLATKPTRDEIAWSTRVVRGEWSHQPIDQMVDLDLGGRIQPCLVPGKWVTR